MKRQDFTGYDNQFATRLRLLMENNKCRQQSLAHAIGSNRQSVSQYMDGSILPRADKLAAMADYFGVSSDFLLGRGTYSTDGDKIVVRLAAVSKAVDAVDGSVAALKRLFNTTDTGVK